jgi:thioredoxin-related protein
VQLFISLTLYLFFQTNTTDTTIVFREIKYSEIFDQAKKENKPIFLYFHFIGCGGCLKMEKTAFINKEIADIINKNFICYSVNISKPDGIEANKIFKIWGFPSFLFLDSDGNIIHQFVGIRTPDEFIREALNALELMKN